VQFNTSPIWHVSYTYIHCHVPLLSTRSLPSRYLWQLMHSLFFVYFVVVRFCHPHFISTDHDITFHRCRPFPSGMWSLSLLCFLLNWGGGVYLRLVTRRAAGACYWLVAVNKPFVTQCMQYHRSGGYLLAFQPGGPGSILWHQMWGFIGGQNWHRDRFRTEFFGYPVSLSFHRCSILI